jgi:hypothetical protein
VLRKGAAIMTGVIVIAVITMAGGDREQRS